MVEPVALAPAVRADEQPPLARDAHREAARLRGRRLLGRRERLAAAGSRPPRATSAAVSSARVVAPAGRARVLGVLPRADARRSSTRARRATRRAAPRSTAAGARRRAGSRRGSPRSARCRQTTQLESSIEPPARSPFSCTVTSAPSWRARAAARGRPSPRRRSRSTTRARTSACARRTRSSRAPGPTRTRRTCSARRRRRRPRRAAPSRRRRESTSTARWFSSGRSGALGSPAWNSRYAPPSSTRGAPSRGSASLKPSETYSRAVASGSRGEERDVVEVVVDLGLRLDDVRRVSPSPTSCEAARSPSFTRNVTCLSAPCSRGPSSSKSVSLKRRASAPSSVKRSVRSIVCMPRSAISRSAIASRSATQSATWSMVRAVTASQRSDAATLCVELLLATVDRPLELLLGHPRAPLDAHPLGLVVELLLRAALGPLRPRAQPAAAARRDVRARRASRTSSPRPRAPAPCSRSARRSPRPCPRTRRGP